jgi:transcriptional regulator with XRE-family HTH domain
MPDFGADQTDRKVFGNEMRALREQKTWTQDDLAGAMNYSVSTVKNLESGYRLPTLDQCVLLDKVFDLPGIFQRMHERHRGIPLSAGFRPFAPHEAEATTLRWFEHVLVPGLFQTEDYARAVLAGRSGAVPDDVQELVDARLARQIVLDRTDPPWMWVVLDEQVLIRDVGGPQVMADQLARLAELARRPKAPSRCCPSTSRMPVWSVRSSLPRTSSPLPSPTSKACWTVSSWRTRRPWSS